MCTVLGVPYYRAVNRKDSTEDVVIATAENYLDVADLAATAIEELGLEEAEIQMSVDGEAWTIVEDDFTLESPDLDL
jgi:ribosomal silencing factor RsfS